MATKSFSFRLSAEGAAQVTTDLRALAATSAEADRALQTLIRASPQLASVADQVNAKMTAQAAAMSNAAGATQALQPLAESTAASMAKLAESSGGLGTALSAGGVMGIGIGAGVALMERLVEKVQELAFAIPHAGDEVKLITARLEAATGNSTMAGIALDSLRHSASQMGLSIEETSTVFSRMNVAAKEVGATTSEVLKLSAGIEKFGIVAGLSTVDLTNGMREVAKGLASGQLQGQELRAILQDIPQFAAAFARELGVGLGDLREMGSQGKLTTDVVLPAMLAAVEKVDEQFAKMPMTIGRAQNALNVSMETFLAQLDKAYGISNRLAAALELAARFVGGAQEAFAPTDEQKSQADLEDAFRRRDKAQKELGDLSVSGNAAGGPGSAYYDRVKEQLDKAEQDIVASSTRLVEIQKNKNKAIAEDEEKSAQTAAEKTAERLNKSLDEYKMHFDQKFKINQEFQKKIDELDKLHKGGVLSDADYSQYADDAKKAQQDALSKLQQSAPAFDDQTRIDAIQKLIDKQQADAINLLHTLDPLTAAADKYKAALETISKAETLYLNTKDQEGGPSGFSPEQAADLRLKETKAYQDEIDKIDSKGKTADKTFNSFFAKTVSGFENAIFAGKSFGSIVGSLEQDIAKLILRMTVLDPLTKSISDGLSGLFGSSKSGGGTAGGERLFSGLFSTIGGYFGFAGGGVMTSAGPMPLRRYSSGGIANTPQLAMFGEGSSPEAFVPVPSGRIPVEMRGGSGGVVVQQGDIHIHAGGSNASAVQIGQVVELASQRATARMLAEINRGGPAAKQVGRRQNR